MKSLYFSSIKALVVALFMFLLLAGSSFGSKKISSGNGLENSLVFSRGFDKDEQRVLELINAERKNQNLNQLYTDSNLTKLARDYSAKMARENFFSHRDKNGKNLVERAKDFNIVGWRGIAENLYKCKGYDDPGVAAVKGWMKSPGHRSNFLNKQWSATGIGIAKAEDGTVYVTQIFLRR